MDENKLMDDVFGDSDFGDFEDIDFDIPELSDDIDIPKEDPIEEVTEKVEEFTFDEIDASDGEIPFALADEVSDEEVPAIKEDAIEIVVDEEPKEEVVEEKEEVIEVPNETEQKEEVVEEIKEEVKEEVKEETKEVKRRGRRSRKNKEEKEENDKTDDKPNKEEVKEEKAKKEDKKETKKETKTTNKEVTVENIDKLINEAETITTTNNKVGRITPNEIKLPPGLLVKIYGTELFSTDDEVNTMNKVRTKLIATGYTEFEDSNTSRLVIKDKYIVDDIKFYDKG